ncbi:AAA family ATPase [Candidatus Woesearchaeota archaeon]|nr:AAA family ATPase [Candidatus Woesearchaeota archaeon]
MQHLIIIRGPPGIGKSTIANELAQKLSGAVTVIDVDVLRWVFIKKRPKNFNDHDLIYKNLWDLTKNSIDEGLTVILEGVLAGRDETGKLRIDRYDLFKKKKIKITKLFLMSKKKTQQERLKKRNKKFITTATAKDFQEWTALSKKSISEEDHIIDTTGKTKKETVDLILSFVLK